MLHFCCKSLPDGAVAYVSIYVIAKLHLHLAYNHENWQVYIFFQSEIFYAIPFLVSRH